MPGLRLAVLAALFLAAACKGEPHWAAATPNHELLERIAWQRAATPSPFAWSTIESTAQRESLARKAGSALPRQASR
jgi:hypothetical protein